MAKWIVVNVRVVKEVQFREVEADDPNTAGTLWQAEPFEVVKVDDRQTVCNAVFSPEQFTKNRLRYLRGEGYQGK